MANTLINQRVDEHFHLLNTMFHALEECETYEQYLKQAENNGNYHLAQFFREAQLEEWRRVTRARELLQDEADFIEPPRKCA